jgi:hypothetical protein
MQKSRLWPAFSLALWVLLDCATAILQCEIQVPQLGQVPEPRQKITPRDSIQRCLDVSQVQDTLEILSAGPLIRQHSREHSGQARSQATLDVILEVAALPAPVVANRLNRP